MKWFNPEPRSNTLRLFHLFITLQLFKLGCVCTIKLYKTYKTSQEFPAVTGHEESHCAYLRLNRPFEFERCYFVQFEFERRTIVCNSSSSHVCYSADTDTEIAWFVYRQRYGSCTPMSVITTRHRNNHNPHRNPRIRSYDA